MIEDQFNDKFHEKRRHIAWRAESICRVLYHLFHPRSVIDVGCSTGDLIAGFKDLGCKVAGIDGPWLKNDLIIPSVRNHVYYVDLRDKSQMIQFPVIPQYDVSMCFMTVGRLGREYWPDIARFLVNLAPVVLTVVENEKEWTAIMKYEVQYMEDVHAADTFKKSIDHLKDKTAVRSFYNHFQVFRRHE